MYKRIISKGIHKRIINNIHSQIIIITCEISYGYPSKLAHHLFMREPLPFGD